MKAFEQLRNYAVHGTNSVAVLLALPAVVMAADEAVPSVPAAAFQPMATGNLVQTVLGLVAVIVLIVTIAWFARRMGRINGGPGNSLRIVGGLSMGTRERVVLIQVGDTQILVGVAPGRVQTLHVLPETVSVGGSGESSDTSFANSLGSLINRRQTA